MVTKSLVKIYLKKGSLPGYTLKDTIKDRRIVLDKLIPKLKWGHIVKKLNILYIFNKNKHPNTAMKFRKDMFYIQKHNKKSKRKSIRSKRKSIRPKRKLKRSKRK